ncbi:type II secretion system F family protein [Desulfosarcina sp. OttesenSCG-928-A07]|nr:type II secretion system F family protein [Desulfosarcina sp. OttesenSCG-928-G17]MDL2329666.1 type II secretion system F family protein [Desulfosarcina sp. OttesenSCG-928-A07]
MPVYKWEGRNKNNRVQKGEMEAESAAIVRRAVTRKQLHAIKIKPKPKDLFEGIAFLQPRVTPKDIILFCRQFSTMIDAGLPLVQCLDILYFQEPNPTFKKILKNIKKDVESGSTLAESLKKYPNLFDSLFVSMVAAGEAGGILDIILRRLSAFLEKSAKLKRKIKGAMIYPLATIGVAVVVVAVIMVFVIPTFQEMFASMGGALPAPTLIVIAISNFVKSNMGWLLLGLAVTITAFRWFYKTPGGRMRIDSLRLRLPVIGMVNRKGAVARFTQTMATMLTSGVSILDSLDIVAQTAGNKIVENAIYQARSGIAEGRTMADPLAETGVFPIMVCQMIAVGERTGALSVMLEKVAEFYNDEVDQAIDTLTALIEPFMLVFLGVMIGGLVISMYLPVFKLAGNL